jgi:hypothetical protein
MTIKEFLFNLKIFLWYLATEPFRQVKEITLSFSKILIILNKTLTWAYIFMVGTIIFLITGKKYAAGILLLFVLIFVLMWEWESGFYMHRYRVIREEKYKQKLESEKNDNIQ